MKFSASFLILSLFLSACAPQEPVSLVPDDEVSLASEEFTADSEVVLLGEKATYNFHFNSVELGILGDASESTVRFQLPKGGTIHLNALPLSQSDVQNHVSTLERWGDHEVYRSSEDLAEPGCRREFATEIAGEEVLLAELTLCPTDNERDAMKAFESLFTQLVISGYDEGPYSL